MAHALRTHVSRNRSLVGKHDVWLLRPPNDSNAPIETTQSTTYTYTHTDACTQDLHRTALQLSETWACLRSLRPSSHSTFCVPRWMLSKYLRSHCNPKNEHDWAHALKQQSSSQSYILFRSKRHPYAPSVHPVQDWSHFHRTFENNRRGKMRVASGTPSGMMTTKGEHHKCRLLIYLETKRLVDCALKSRQCLNNVPYSPPHELFRKHHRTHTNT